MQSKLCRAPDNLVPIDGFYSYLMYEKPVTGPCIFSKEGREYESYKAVDPTNGYQAGSRGLGDFKI